MPRPLLTLLLSLLLALAAPTSGLAEKISGYAEYRKDGVLLVDGQRVEAASKAKVRGDARRFNSIPLGWEVTVKGSRQADGSILARRIVAERNRDNQTELELKASFDRIEAQYRNLGRMKIVDSSGKVLEDFGPIIQDGLPVSRVRRITAQLAPPYLEPGDIRVYVVDNEEWNAMAAPNYSLYVFTGLLDDMDDDEVALVLGHELAHATHEHSRRQYSRRLWIAGGATAAALLAGETIDDDATALAAQMGTVLAASAVISGYGRDQEDQADRVGMRYAYEAGYEVGKGPQLWQRFSDKYGETSTAVNFFFGDHSRSSKRADLMQEEIAHNYRQSTAGH